MKRKILCGLAIMMLVLLVAVGCGGSAAPETTPPSPAELERQGFQLPEIPRITCYELKALMDEGQLMYVVDVRPTALYNLGHLPDSLNIPSDEWRDASEEEIAKLLQLPKNRLIVLYCD